MKYLNTMLWFTFSKKQKRTILASAMMNQVEGDYTLTEHIDFFNLTDRQFSGLIMSYLHVINRQ